MVVWKVFQFLSIVAVATCTIDPEFQEILDALVEDDAQSPTNIGPWVREDFTIVPVSSPAHLMHAWQGDGQEVPPELPLDEEMILVRSLLKYGPIQAPEIVGEIQRLIPSSTWTLREVSYRLRRFKSLFVVPGRLHRSLMELTDNGRITRIDDMQIIDRLETTAGNTPDVKKRMHEWANDWLSACIVPSSSAEPPCIEMHLHRTEGITNLGMTITVPRFVAFLRSIEANRIAELRKKDGSSPAKGTTRLRTDEAVVAVSRPVKRAKTSPVSKAHQVCVLKAISKRRVATYDIMLAEVNACLVTEIMSMERFDEIRASYMKFTRNSAEFQNLLRHLDKSSHPLPKIVELMTAAFPTLEFMEKRVRVWLSGCIAPLAAFEGKTGSHRPCWFEKSVNSYQLSQTQIREFLRKELESLETVA